MNPILLLLPCLALILQESADLRPRRPKFPIFEALDVDHDGVISAHEIANAPKALQVLDKDGDGQLSPDEYRPPRPDGQSHPVPPKEGVTPRGDKVKRPRPLLDTVLDADGDEVISAAEIAQAPVLLKQLDKNGDGRLTPDELGFQPAKRAPGAYPTPRS